MTATCGACGVNRTGLGGAVIEGWISSSADLLAVIDGDLQHDETFLPKMYVLFDEGRCDLAIGTRLERGDDRADEREEDETGRQDVPARVMSDAAEKIEADHGLIVHIRAVGVPVRVQAVGLSVRPNRASGTSGLPSTVRSFFQMLGSLLQMRPKIGDAEAGEQAAHLVSTSMRSVLAR